MRTPDPIRLFETTPLKRSPLFGVFLGWPEDGEEWIHPLDIGVARHLLPGQRIFRRDDDLEGFYRYSYGSLHFRARPKMWFLVEHEGFDVDDFVEIKSAFGKRWPMLAKIREIVWNHHSKRIEYRLQGYGRKIHRAFHAEEIQLARTLDSQDSKFPAKAAPIGSVASILRRP